MQEQREPPDPPLKIQEILVESKDPIAVLNLPNLFAKGCYLTFIAVSLVIGVTIRTVVCYYIVKYGPKERPINILILLDQVRLYLKAGVKNGPPFPKMF